MGKYLVNDHWVFNAGDSLKSLCSRLRSRRQFPIHLQGKLPLALVSGVRGELIVVAVILTVITEMTGVVGVQIGGSRHYEGPMGKSDRAFVFGLLSLLLACGVPPGRWLDVFLGLLIVLLVVTIVNRGRAALKEVA